jgi:hypothetical protein
LDSNDNAPKFDRSIYNVTIDENQPINTTLLRVHADDSDQNENARVTYALADGLAGHPFVTIDERTGIIRNRIVFDYETMTNFTFNVTAVDHPKHGRTLTTWTTVSVTIVDQNDNSPQVSGQRGTSRRSLCFVVSDDLLTSNSN